MLKQVEATGNVYYGWDGGHSHACHLMHTIVTKFNPYLSCYQIEPQMIYEQRLTGRSRYMVLLDSTYNRSFEAGVTLTDKTSYQYDENYLLLINKIFTDAYDSVYTEAYTYPTSTSNTFGYNHLFADNRVAEVVETTLTKGGVEKRKERKEYEKIGIYTRLKRLSTSLNGLMLENRLELTYDTANNISEVLKNPVNDEDTFTSYIWGYNNSVPILKVSGASIDEVVAAINADASLSTPAADGSQAYSATQHQTLSNALGEAH